MRSHRHTAHALTAEAASAICSHFASIGDSVFDYMSQLQSRGFAAFLPAWEFVCSYCPSPEAQETHRRCTIEVAKAVLGRPWPFNASDEDKKVFYRSAYLSELRQKRDLEFGMSARDFAARFPDEIWRLEIDPCSRAWMRASFCDGDAYRKREQDVQEARRKRIAEEASLHTRASDFLDSPDAFGHMDVTIAVMRRELQSLGFRYDDSRSLGDCPVFSKAVARGWLLCWSLGDARSLVGGPNEGYFKPMLDMRLAGIKGSVDSAQPNEFLIIRYQKVVPGFNAYMRFRDLRELEVMIKAHLALYRLMAAIIEDAPPSVLGAPEEA
jgi:hypothetical protein